MKKVYKEGVEKYTSERDGQDLEKVLWKTFFWLYNQYLTTFRKFLTLTRRQAVFLRQQLKGQKISFTPTFGAYFRSYFTMSIEDQ